jgi:hypothetical protein
VILSDGNYSINSIKEYAIYEIDKPFFLRELNILNDVFALPLSVYLTPYTNFFAIQTFN